MAAGTPAHDAGHDADDVIAPRSDDVVVMSGAASQEEDAQAVKQPMHSTRGAAPGPGGCWALNKHGDPCRAARRAEGDYCAAHSGLGIAANPALWAGKGAATAAANRRKRAMLRMELGITRQNTLKGVLKAHAYVERERIAGRVIGAVLDPDVPPAQAARLGLDLIDAVDPQATATLTAPLDPDGVSALSLSQLIELGANMGLSTPPLNGPVGAIESESSE